MCDVVRIRRGLYPEAASAVKAQGAPPYAAAMGDWHLRSPARVAFARIVIAALGVAVLLGMVLLVVASLAFGVLLVAATRNMRMGLSLAGFLAAPAFAYQVTGPVLDVTDSKIVVEKGKEKWEIERTKDTKVTGDLKKGSRVWARGGMALNKYLVSATRVILAPKKVIEANLIKRS